MVPKHQLLTAEEVGRELRLSKHKVYAMMDRREIGFVVTGERRRRIPRSAIAEWITRSTVHPRLSS